MLWNHPEMNKKTKQKKHIHMDILSMRSLDVKNVIPVH